MIVYDRGRLWNLWRKVYSPLGILIALIAVIIAGNILNWTDKVYGTTLHVWNPLLVIAAVFLFGIYICCIRKQFKQEKKGS